MTNTYGLAIIAFTVLVKVVTLPLNYKQIESTTKMQAIQPMVRVLVSLLRKRPSPASMSNPHPPLKHTKQMKEIQQKYKSDPQLQQQKMAQLYQDNNVNPLAGCLPALVQIPIFISLYRALTNLAAQVNPSTYCTYIHRLSVCCRRMMLTGLRHHNRTS